jgi:3',5'-cyclic AMP phosphodiesterase CpdA
MRRLSLLALLWAVPCLAGAIAGRVFLDGNADGLWQATDTPCPGVLVSDGQTLVATAADGTYTLAASDGPQVVFIENPAQTWPAQGFWRHLSTGTGTADFPLRSQEQKLPFIFVQGTDLHTRPDVGDKMAQYVAAVNNLPFPVAFVVHTGDLVVDAAAGGVAPARALFATYQTQVAGLKAPLFNLPGNHEHVSWYMPTFDANEPGIGKGLYREVFGPMHYAFTYAGVRFIALDGTDFKDGKLVYGMPAECLSWLKAYLARVPATDRLVLLVHEPLSSLPQKAELEQVLAGRKIVVTLAGHWHTTNRTTFAGAPEIIGGATSYAWHGAIPPADAMGYQVVRISDSSFDSAFGDWAEKYPVTIATPSYWAGCAGKTAVRVQFLDPKAEVQSAQIKLENVSQEVTALGQDGLYRSASATLDLTALPDGIYDLYVTLRGSGEPFVEKQPRLLRNKQDAPFTATGPATLRMRLNKVNAANLIKVNGEQVGTTPADAGPQQAFSVAVSATLLRRLNRIEFFSVLLPDGKTYDDFWAGQLTLEYGGKAYRDPRSSGGSSATLNGTQPSTWPCWIDLGYPQR